MNKGRLQKSFLALLIILAFINSEPVNGQIRLIGMTYGGGAHSGGTIFKINADGSGFQILYSFDTLTGINPYGNLLQANDGRLYGMTFMGGTNFYGALFRFDPDSYTYEDVYNFSPDDGASPYGSLIQATNGLLYGMTSGGGTMRDGVIFSFDPVTNTYTNVFNFVDSLGRIPKGSLVQANDGNLYGMTVSGGKQLLGTLFSFNPANNKYSKLVDFNFANGMFPFGNLMEAGDGMLYGTARQGGADSVGVLFRFNPAEKCFTKLLDFAGGIRQSPSAGLTMANGLLYGMTLQGGLNNLGSVYSFDTAGYIYNDILDFDSLDGSSPFFNTLMQASNGMLYGMTDQGGTNNTGVLFSLDPSCNAYTKRVDFTGANGKNPKGTLLELDRPTGISNRDNDYSISVYPNPVKNSLQLAIANWQIANSKFQVEIYNMLGAKCQSEICNQQSEMRINVSSLPSGVYVVQIKSIDRLSVSRFVKE